MIPNAEIRFTSVARALREVVLPALDPAEALAREQAALAADQIDMLCEQWDGAVENALATRDGWRDLVGEVVPIARGGSRTDHARRDLEAAASTRDVSVRLTTIEDESARLSRFVQALIHAMIVDGHPHARREVCSAVVRHALQQSVDDRRWFSRTGLDPDAADMRATRSAI